MAAQQMSDAELVETFLGQADRYTHSGLKLSDCFSRTAFELVFKYGTILQMSAARQALIACNSLPAVDPRSVSPVRHVTFERHLNHLLLHILGTIADDGNVANSDRVVAKLLVETAADRTKTPITKSKDDRHVVADIHATLQRLEQDLKNALRVRD